jgi:chromosome segregation ATPase
MHLLYRAQMEIVAANEERILLKRTSPGGDEPPMKVSRQESRDILVAAAKKVQEADRAAELAAQLTPVGPLHVKYNQSMTVIANTITDLESKVKRIDNQVRGLNMYNGRHTKDHGALNTKLRDTQDAIVQQSMRIESTQSSVNFKFECLGALLQRIEKLEKAPNARLDELEKTCTSLSLQVASLQSLVENAIWKLLPDPSQI